MTRTTANLLLGLCGIALLGLITFQFLVPAPSGPAELEAPTGQVLSLIGQVEIMASGTQRWKPIQALTTLREADQMLTGLFSEAVVRTRSEILLTVEASTHLGLKGGDEVSLKMGQLEASVPAGQALLVSAQGTDASVLTGAGESRVYSDGSGTVLVDSLRGNVKLLARGRTVLIPGGSRMVLSVGREPLGPTPLPSAISLQAQWPPLKTSSNKVRVTGSTSMGAVVLVNGFLTRVEPDGGFSLEVPLREGANQLMVHAMDPSGVAKSLLSPPIVVDTKPQLMHNSISGGAAR